MKRIGRFLTILLFLLLLVANSCYVFAADTTSVISNFRNGSQGYTVDASNFTSGTGTNSSYIYGGSSINYSSSVKAMKFYNVSRFSNCSTEGTSGYAYRRLKLLASPGYLSAYNNETKITLDFWLRFDDLTYISGTPITKDQSSQTGFIINARLANTETEFYFCIGRYSGGPFVSSYSLVRELLNKDTVTYLTVPAMNNHEGDEKFHRFTFIYDPITDDANAISFYYDGNYVGSLGRACYRTYTYGTPLQYDLLYFTNAERNISANKGYDNGRYKASSTIYLRDARIYRKAINISSPISKLGLMYMYPMQNYYYCTQVDSSVHNGLDLVGYTGAVIANANIQCPIDGTIIGNEYHNSGGYSILVRTDHELSDGRDINLMFLHRIDKFGYYGEALTVDSRVSVGDSLGRTGTSGVSSGFHLHFSAFAKDCPDDRLTFPIYSEIQAVTNSTILYNAFPQVDFVYRGK